MLLQNFLFSFTILCNGVLGPANMVIAKLTALIIKASIYKTWDKVAVGRNQQQFLHGKMMLGQDF